MVLGTNWQRQSGFSLFLLIALLVIAFIFGGSSRMDALSQIPMRGGAIVIAAALLVSVPSLSPRRLKPLWVAYGCFVALLAFQLVPLSPALWREAPGRQLLAHISDLAGMAASWRPLSVVPEATFNALLATLPGIGALLCMTVCETRSFRWIVAACVIMGLISAAIGLLQISSGEPYFFAITNRGSAVGIFANRNHQAAMLSALLPALVLVVMTGTGNVSARARYFAIAAILLFLLPMIVVTGSRAGLVLMVVGCVGGALLMRDWAPMLPAPPRRSQGSDRLNLWSMIGVCALVVGMLVIIAVSKAPALMRLLGQDLEADARVRLFTPMVHIAAKYFPVGSGFGTFPTVFKIDEPAWWLGSSYFNHAHNDFMEIIIEGGAASIALLVLGVIWWVITTIRIWRAPVTRNVLFGRLGSVQSGIFVLASLSDYPLRTPLCQILMVVACAMTVLAVRESINRELTGLDDFVTID